jgi:hypothetical protein
MEKKSGFTKGPKEGEAPFVTPGDLITTVEGLAVDAGFGDPTLSEFRTDVPNVVAEGTFPLTRPDGSKSTSILGRFLKSAKQP